MARHFRIHPGIGVARVGNAPNEFFIGPEQPGRPANWGNNQFESFRDDAGLIKRQAARFRVFEYTEDNGVLKNPREVTIGTDVVDIEWRVHVANRKASFFTFYGQHGAPDAYRERSGKPATAPLTDNSERTNKRNPLVPEADRAGLLDIDPGEQLISQAKPGPVILTNTNEHIPFIKGLGELRRDDGRLLVLGGHGTSGSTEATPRQITDYANNDTWFDDLSDGSVKARVRFSDGTFIDADAAWVLVGPPDFAPGIGNVVSLYDTLWDISVRTLPLPAGNGLFADGPLQDLSEQQRFWRANKERSLVGYSPSFTREIFPILARALLARWVFDPGEMDRDTFHVVQLAMSQMALLASPDSGDAKNEGLRARQTILGRLRNPSSDKVNWIGMPRGLGDDYDRLDEGEPTPQSFLSLTRVQYALLEQWAAGKFQADWPGTPPDIPAAGSVTPEGLDQAALENAVGGPFYPGIEVSWLIRERALYAEPFRLNVARQPASEAQAPLLIGALEFGPGFFTQQMALPWQADFYDCHHEEHAPPDDDRPRFYMWWTAQRPDDVFPAGATERQRWVRTFDKFATTPDDPDNEENFERFSQMQQRWHELKFIIRKNDHYEEEP